MLMTPLPIRLHSQIAFTRRHWTPRPINLQAGTLLKAVDRMQLAI